jgi:hypothetical protein
MREAGWPARDRIAELGTVIRTAIALIRYIAQSVPGFNPQQRKCPVDGASDL